VFLSDKLQKVGLYVDKRDIYSVNVGNLHLVVFTKTDLFTLSERVAKTSLFLDGVNLERVYEIDESDVNNPKLYVEVYERGSGKTLSCGSGAVSVAYSYLHKKYGEILPSVKVTVITDGGALYVHFIDGIAYLSGEVKQVYRGIIDEI
jgi:diaminopimelate epimerase